MSYQMHDAQDNAHDAVRDGFRAAHTPIYNSRGCDYEVEITTLPDDSANQGEFGVVVYCYNSEDELVWDGATGVSEDMRMIDAVRAARQTSNL
ncbi:hypothetical protein [Salinibacter grassmerensis]|uniref:hypothetical protein n=1 Tax=Salinibacter grassmerensis TaxID=3040353 RepID=UPI0021E735DB|nr:hypothetical protein [Salinibacter grassmerensis]